MTAIKVLFVCQWYAPEPVSQPTWIVGALRRAGADVEVLTGIPNYPTGKVAAGYSAVRWRSETIDGVTVWRTPLYPSHDSRPMRRFANYATWSLSSAVLGLRRFRRADVALVYSSPATAALPAMVAKTLMGKPYVLLIQDVWPDSIFSSGFLPGRLGAIARRVVDVFASRAYAMASHVFVISPGMLDLLASRGVPRQKMSLLFNWVDQTRGSDVDVAREFRARLGLSDDDFVIMYAGNHGAAQGLDEVVEAVAQIPRAERCHLVLVGDGMTKARLKELATRVCPDRVHFVDAQPRECMPDVMGAADAQVVSLINSPIFAVTLPSKVQSVMAAAHPLLMVASGDAAKVVSDARAGVVAPPGDAEAIASAILRLRTMSPADRATMGLRGRGFYESRMSEQVGAAHMMSWLRRASTDRPGDVGTSDRDDRMKAWD